MQEREELGQKICHLSHLFKRRMDSSIAALCPDVRDSVTGRNGWVICYLMQNRDREVFQRDLERKFGIRRSTVSNMIDLMEEKGLLRRVSSSSDARMKRLELTERAVDLYRDLRDATLRIEETVRSRLTAEEAETLSDLLDKVTGILRSNEAEYQQERIGLRENND